MRNSISIKNISKCYKLYDSRNDRLKEWLIPFGPSRHREKWVLKDINLEVKAGEAVGIIGLNGAGKSTLLKIITGTTIPTTGSVHFSGTVAALLELGLGFHPDFTGRQNVYMSGQLLGYSIDEINACMAQVEEFAEIGEAIDALVRTYSSGMQVRLAFSVATMKRPDILIVDEALSVGDAYFQHKSFGRIKEFCKAGTTLLLVSHDAAAIQAVCDRAVLLDHGQVARIGDPQEVMDYYNAMLGDTEAKTIQQVRQENGQVQTISGSGEARISGVHLLNRKGLEPEFVDVGEPVRICVDAQVMQDIPSLTCGIMIKNRLGESVYGTNSDYAKKELHDLKAGKTVHYEFSMPMNIGEGNYSLTVALHSGRDHIANNYEWRDLAAVFEVLNQGKQKFTGVAYLGAEVTVQEE
ncbi:MAG: ABC transporter ATP-binding protein [Selenomonadaceae bacterium]|nr:ABC transporter ATP-binding protein [Selenomonadaceae bacterium]